MRSKFLRVIYRKEICNRKNWRLKFPENSIKALPKKKLLSSCYTQIILSNSPRLWFVTHFWTAYLSRPLDIRIRDEVFFNVENKFETFCLKYSEIKGFLKSVKNFPDPFFQFSRHINTGNPVVKHEKVECKFS